jgi:hypothetical protein
VVFENGAQELGDGEDVLGVTDRPEDVRVEPFGEEARLRSSIRKK